MDKVKWIGKSLKDFFNKRADALAISTGFIKRKRKLKGSCFAKALIIGSLEDLKSIESLCHLLDEESIEITKQGLHSRFTQEAVKFMRLMYEESFHIFESRLQLNCPILQLFKRVKILDSSYMSLPNNMESLYKGYGSCYKNRTNCSKSGIKVQLTYDYLNQRIDRIDLKEGVRSDQDYKDYLAEIERDDLLIADLGYFVPNSFKYIHESKAYFISRYKSDTNLYEVETNQKIDLLKHLDQEEFLIKEVLLGKETKLKVRLIGYKVTSEQAEHRRRKANKLAKSHGYTSSNKNQKLLGWSLFITNIPETKIKAKNIGLLYKVRWQIELLFKLYKSHFRLDKFQTSNSFRVLCELYARLCGILIFHALATCLTVKEGAEISLTKAYLDLKRRARELFLVLQKKTTSLFHFIVKSLNSWQRFSLKDRYRKARLSTFSSLKLIDKIP